MEQMLIRSISFLKGPATGPLAFSRNKLIKVIDNAGLYRSVSHKSYFVLVSQVGLISGLVPAFFLTIPKNIFGGGL